MGGSDYDRSIHSNPDASAWAAFFEETRRDNGWPSVPDEETMAGWFANAMMAMHDHIVRTRLATAERERDVAREAARTVLRDFNLHWPRHTKYNYSLEWPWLEEE